VDKLAQSLDFTQDTSGRVHMRDGQDLVFLLLQRLFHLVELWSVTNWRLQLCRLDAVSLEAVGERVGEISGV
jgi:hypothetical protein